ncbi:MAG: glycosyltransferase family 39 protein [Elusimicrobiota bacterium]|nr:glycosyltransferase family 39 protein [Elusimicrobiota bacterium]
MEKPPQLEGSGGDEVWLAGAVFLALALRAVFFSALTGYDEFAYSRIAGDIADGTFRFKDVSGYYGFRYLVTFPAALFHKLFGQNPYSAAAWPLLCSLSNTVLAYYLGREIFGRRAGILSAFFQAFLPISVVYGTMLYPDEILVFWTGLSALFFLRGSKMPGRWGGAGLLALSGLFAGLGWHTRLNSAVMLLVYAVWIVRRGPRPAHLALACGFLSALIPDWAAGAALAGDPLFSLRSQLAKLSADPGVYPAGHFVYLRGLLGIDLYGLALFGFYFYFFIAACAVAAFKKELSRLWVPLAWFAVLFAYLEFGPASISPYQPVHKQLRFLSMGFFPLIITTAHFVSGLKRRYLIAAAAFLLLTSAGASWKMSAYRAVEAAPLKSAAGYLTGRSPSAIYADGNWGNSLGYYLREIHKQPYYRGAGAAGGFIKPLDEAASAAALSGACAVTGSSDGNSPWDNSGPSPALLRLGNKPADIFIINPGAKIYCFK